MKKTPINTTTRTDPAATKDENTGGKEAATNTVANMISVGKRPLHGTKLLVKIAIKRSRGELSRGWKQLQQHYNQNPSPSRVLACHVPQLFETSSPD